MMSKNVGYIRLICLNPDDLRSRELQFHSVLECIR
jgi:hypothetical protein